MRKEVSIHRAAGSSPRRLDAAQVRWVIDWYVKNNYLKELP